MLAKTEGKRKRGQQRMSGFDGITDSMDMSLSTLGDSEGQGSLGCCSSWGHKQLDTTWQLNNNNNKVALVVKNPPASIGDMRNGGSVPGWGRSPRGGNGTPLQYFYWKNPMNRGAWQATVHWSQKSDVTKYLRKHQDRYQWNRKQTKTIIEKIDKT